MKKRLFLSCLVLILAGCVSLDREHIKSHSKKPMRPPVLNQTGYEYVETPIAMRLIRQTSRDSEHYTSTFFSFPSYGENNQEGNLVTGEYLASREPGKKKLVIVLPIWGASDFPPSLMAKELTDWNHWLDTNVLYLDGRVDLFDWPAMERSLTESVLLREIESSVARVKNTVIDIRRLIDWAESRPEIDSRRIGIIGFSISAVVASVASAVEPRIKAGVSVMGGGNFHEIMGFCSASDVLAARQAILKRFGWSAKELEAKVEPASRLINPVRYGAGINPGRFLIIESADDQYIPHSARDDLWEAFGRPERLMLKYNHRMAFATMTPALLNFTDRTITNFFREKL